MREMAQEQYLEAKDAISRYTEELKIMLLPKDPNDSRNVIIEIRAGSGRRGSRAFCQLLAKNVYYVC